MRDALAIIVPTIAGLIILLAFAVAVGYCWNDAKRRGKPPLLVSLLVFCSFPLGLLAWLIFRPEPLPPPPPLPTAMGMPPLR
jgi:UDP-N-acetylmuramyl pentapeptide phosphotransferase/UDP-N-acetylglucosamine-1-phosphate transferase